jgi:hypothetical protein
MSNETKEKCKICEKNNVELTFVEKRYDQNFEGGLLCLDCLKNLDFYRELHKVPRPISPLEPLTKICGKCGIDNGELIYLYDGDVSGFGPGFICSSCYKTISEKEK